MYAAIDGADHVQVAEGGVLHIGERCCRTRAVEVEGERVAVALEGAYIGVGVVAYLGAHGDVGHEDGVHLAVALGRLHAVGKGVPVGSAAYDDGVGIAFAHHLVLPLVGEGLVVHGDDEGHLIGHAGAVERHRLLSGRYLVGGEHDGGGVNGMAVAVDGHEAHLHLCAAVPHGAQLVFIAPAHLDAAGRIVVPGCRIGVAHLQQVQVFQRAALRSGCGIVVESPQLACRGTHHYIVGRDGAALELCLGEVGGDQRVLETIVGRALLEEHRADGLHLFYVVLEAAQHDELVAVDDVLAVGILHFPRQLHRAAIAELVVRAVAQLCGGELLRLVHHTVVFVFAVLRASVNREIGIKMHTPVLIGGRYGDEA